MKKQYPHRHLTMTTELPNPHPDQLLAAFADGELEGEQNRQMLKRLSQDPALADRIAEQQELRKAVARAGLSGRGMTIASPVLCPT